MTKVETILSQLGGNKFIKMTGANKIASRDKDTTLSFWFKMCRKSNICLVHLNGKDLYDITFHQYSRKNLTTTKKQEYNDVYAENIRELFESYTGLRTSL